MSKKILSLWLALTLVFSMIVPSVVFATDEANQNSCETILPYENYIEDEPEAMTFNLMSANLLSTPNVDNNISLLSSNTSTIRDTVLVLDNSVSMEGTAMNVLKSAAIKFCESVLSADGTNRVSVVTYDTNITDYCDFTNDITVLMNTINSMDAEGSWTNINAGLEKADDLLQNSSANIKNIVVMTDGVPTAGKHTSTGRYSYSDYSGTHNADYYCYEYANSLYNTATELKDTYSIYSLGFFHSMYSDTKTFASKVLQDIQNSGYYEVINAEDLEFTFGDIADDVVNKNDTFKFGGYLVQSEDTEATYYYDDSYFTTDAKIYNPHLATMSMCFELTTWTSFEGKNWTTDVSDANPKFINARNLLIGDINDENDNGIGFDTFAVNDFWANEPTKDSIGAVVAKKTIVDDGEEYTLLALGIRGGGYGQEWASNFTIGNEGQHDGFATAKSNVLDFLKKYISDNNITGNLKLWVVGFSRAGATANMVAGALNDGYNLSANTILTPNNIYAYTFEAPQGATSSQVNGDYSNIHNRINVNDIVPLVAPSNWGFARYNSDRWFPSAYDSNFSSKLTTMKGFYNPFKENAIEKNSYQTEEELNKVEYKIKEHATRTDIKIDMSKFLPGGDPLISFNEYNVPTREVLTDAITFLTDGVIGDREAYYTSLQAGIRTLMAKFMGGATWGDALGGGTLTFDEFMQRICNELTLEKTIDIMSPIWAFNLDSPEKRLDKVKQNISTFVSELLEDSDLWGNIKFAVEIKDTLIMLLENTFMEIARECLDLNVTPLRSVGDIINLAIGGMDLFQPHHPEICLSWLMSLDSNYNKNLVADKTASSYRLIRINCPVNVDVYDSNNTLVASIVNDEIVNNIDSCLNYHVNGDGEKIITLPANDEYNISITSTGDGTLNYSISEVDLQTMSNTRIVNYYNVPISEGDVLSGTIPSFSDEDIDNSNINGSNTTYTLFDNDDTLIQADEDISGIDATNANYTVSIETDNNFGMAIGGGRYAKGSFAQVEAYPVVGGSLIGWFNGEELISTDETYRFAVTEDVNLIAKFSEVERHSLTFAECTGGTISNEDGEYSSGSQICVEVSPKTGYTFTGWSSNSGEFEDSSLTTTWFTMPDTDVVITANFKKNSTGGGGGGTSTYTVKFETNGGSKVSNKSVRRNNTVTEPTSPTKDGYTFAGWYSDKELTKEFDFATKVTKGFTLYAKWDDIKKSQIILTIGEKEALVFGEIKENDVAPKIVNDRTMLPIRFIAEALGAEVIWTEVEPNKVVIKKDDIEIVINIGSDTALVNNKKVELDSPAFIENDRTYLPLRFISENLGAKVEWVEDIKQVIITK